ncbi:MAG TPA: CoA transferase [Candidatus Bathyarchaeia archaeon]|nr:CoA transferase [Candidatus Bathyarchaeia archaeon]
MSAAPPLAGLRILDVGTRIGAPFAATLLGDFGAEVIKIEQPGVGDFMRTIGPFEDGYSLWWAVEGRNKKSVTCDLRKPEGQELFKRLVRHADAIVENFQPGTLEGWGLGYEVLERINPRIVLSRVSVYGQTGPYRLRPGLDRNGIAMGGLLHLTGYPDRPPVRPGVIISDYLTGVFNALSLMMALYHRDAPSGSGQGQEIDLSLYGSVMRILEHTIAAYDRLGIVRGREGNRLKNSAPLDNWETADGEYVSIIAAGDGLFPRLAKLIGREDLLADARFSTLRARCANADAANGVVAEWCKHHTAAEIERLCLAADVPFARTYSVKEICEDPHIQSRGDIVQVDDPVVGPVRMQGLHARLSRTPGEIRHGAPKLGQHNDEIYGGLLGLGADELRTLREKKII